MSKIGLRLSLLVLILTLPAFVFGQKVTRVKFAKNATKAVVAGKLCSYKGSANYIIRLRQGQRLQIEADRSITLTVLDPAGEDVMDRAANCNGRADISPTVAGDYKIEVVECMKADAWRGTFRLTIKVK